MEIPTSASNQSPAGSYYLFVFGPPGTATVREIVAYNAEKYGRSEADEWLWFVQTMFDDWEDPLQHPNLLAKIADQHYGDGTEIVIRFQSQRIDSKQLPSIQLSLTKQGRPQLRDVYVAYICTPVLARMIEASWGLYESHID